MPPAFVISGLGIIAGIVLSILAFLMFFEIDE